jgi:hypothetical protein
MLPDKDSCLLLIKIYRNAPLSTKLQLSLKKGKGNRERGIGKNNFCV